MDALMDVCMYVCMCPTAAVTRHRQRKKDGRANGADLVMRQVVEHLQGQDEGRGGRRRRRRTGGRLRCLDGSVGGRVDDGGR